MFNVARFYDAKVGVQYTLVSSRFGLAGISKIARPSMNTSLSLDNIPISVAVHNIKHGLGMPRVSNC
jgi:hypothetical protein